MIIRGGFNVYPGARSRRSIPRAPRRPWRPLLVGMPHDELGEEIGAAVVLKARQPGGRRGDQALRQGARGGRTSTPRLVWIEDALAEGPDRQESLPAARSSRRPA